MKKLRTLVLSWDTFAAIIATAVVWKFVPIRFTNQLALTIYGTAISVLSIIFSIFFASLAVIMAFPDNEFIAFIEKPHRLFSRLLTFFRTTLGALFISLVYTLVAYVVASFQDSQNDVDQTLFLIFIFAFTYSLFATAVAVDVTLKLTSSRSTYLTTKYSQEGTSEGDSDSQ